MRPSASYALAEEFTVIPFPFSGEARKELEAEYSLLLSSEVHPKEISDMILFALEVLLNKRAKAKDAKTFDKITHQISDMLGRLLVFEELLNGSKK